MRGLQGHSLFRSYYTSQKPLFITLRGELHNKMKLVYCLLLENMAFIPFQTLQP